MAYNPKNLSALAYANGFTLWHYRGNTPVSEMLLPKYWNRAAPMLRVGDVMHINANMAGNVQCVTVFVTGNRRGAVEVQPCHPVLVGPSASAQDAA